MIFKIKRGLSVFDNFLMHINSNNEMILINLTTNFSISNKMKNSVNPRKNLIKRFIVISFLITIVHWQVSGQNMNQEKKEGFTILFDGKDLDQWQGNKTAYFIENNHLVVRLKKGGHGNLYTIKEYSDFIFRFEFKLTPGANNGLGIHTPLKGDAAYEGKEIQILDNTADKYKNLKPYQYHGSVYGIIPAKRGYLKPVGEWNTEEVTVKGDHIIVTLNGTVIVDGNMKEAAKNGTLDHKDHPGLKRNKGHIAFLGHGDELDFKNIRIKDLSK